MTDVSGGYSFISGNAVRALFPAAAGKTKRFPSSSTQEEQPGLAMSRIEELPGGLDVPGSDQAKVTPLPPSTETPFPIQPKPAAAGDASTTPSLPPAMDSIRSYSADEIVRMMKKTPLFMTNLEERSGGDEGMHEVVCADTRI